MQSARSKFALLAAAALTLAVLALIAWQWGAGSSIATVTAAIPSASAPAAQASAAVEGIAPVPIPSESTRREAPVAPEVSHAVTQPTDAAAAHLATVVLKGMIESNRDDLQLAQVVVRPTLWGDADDFGGEDVRSSRPSHLEANARADGSFEFDVTSLIQSPNSASVAQALSVSVLHPTLARATTQVSVPSVDHLHREARIELTTAIRMTQTMVRVVGRAWTVDGAAASIQISALDVASGESDGWLGAAKYVGKDHGFALDVQAPADYAIVAIADGYRPCTYRVSVKPGGDVTLPPLVLDHGLTIRGRVKLGARTSFAGATVAAQPAGSFIRSRVAGKALAYFDDGFEWANRSARVDASGNYELSELGPRAYSVATSGIQDAYLSNPKSHEFVAPCTSADLTLGSVCEVHVSFHGADQPRATRFGVRQQLAGGGASFGSQESGADGRATLFLEPGITTSLEVGERTFPVPACTSGASLEMRVDL